MIELHAVMTAAKTASLDTGPNSVLAKVTSWPSGKGVDVLLQDGNGDVFQMSVAHEEFTLVNEVYQELLAHTPRS